MLKNKRILYITSIMESEATLHGKNLIIDESLYGLKTSAARFHENSNDSLQRLGCKKTKYDLD
jgi:hypothetical protein